MENKLDRFNNFRKISGFHAKSKEGFDVIYEGRFRITYLDDYFRVSFEIDQSYDEDIKLYILSILKKTVKISYLKHSDKTLNEIQISKLAIDRITEAVQFLGSEGEGSSTIDVI